MTHDITAEDIDAYLGRFTLTPAQQRAIRDMEQRSEAWLSARNHRITGSRFGACAGHSKYQTPSMTVRDMLWSSFSGNSATAYGTAMEPVACDAYVSWLKEKRKSEGFTMDVYVEDSGLHVRSKKPWYAASPDGIIFDVERNEQGEEVRSMGLLEIKCPYSKKDKTGASRFYGDIIPQMYYDQIQGLMGIISENDNGLTLNWCDFFVWGPSGFQVSRHPFRPDYWESLDKEINKFYRKMFLPALIYKERGLLKTNDIQVVPNIHLPKTYADWFMSEDLERCEKPLTSDDIRAKFS